MRTTIFIFLGIICTCFVQAQTVNIPDQQFYNALIADGSIDLDNDGFIQVSEAESADTLKVDNNNIEDLTGIEAFKNIIYLDCSVNALTSLDLSNNKALKSLNCGFNNISTLEISKNTQLRILDCGINPLKTLNVSKNVNLEEIHCFYNELSTLNLASNSLLKILRCDNNSIATLDVSKNTALTLIACPYNNILDLDVSKNKDLQTLDCYNNKLLYLDLSNNPQLIYLQCYNNKLQSLNVSKNTALESLLCTLNPNLKVICVWNVGEVEKRAQFQKDPTAVWVDTCKSFTSVQEELNTNSTYKIHPNPAEDLVYMSPMVQEAIFYDAVGVMVMKRTVLDASVDLSALNTGVYMVKLMYANGHTSCQKLLKK